MKKKYLLAILFIVIAITFCGTATAEEQNNIQDNQSDTDPITTVNDQATNNETIQNNVQDNSIDDTSNTTNSTQDTQSDTNPQTTVNDPTNNEATQNTLASTLASTSEDTPEIVITFDDGFESAYTIAYPIMQQYGIKGTVYVNPAWVGAPGYLTLEELTILHNAGWTIASHTWDHPFLPELSGEEVTTELQSTINWLNNNGFQDGAYHLAYPYGGYNDTVLEVCSQLGIKTARTVNWGTISNDNINYLQLPIILIRSDVTRDSWQSELDSSIAQKNTAIFLLHNIVTGNPIILEDITVDTFNEIIAYISQTGVKTLTINQWYNEVNDTIPPTASATPAGGTYSTTQTVTLTANEPATIYYTTNGSTPTTSSTQYTAPIVIGATTVLKFFAVDTAGNPSGMYTATYTINTAPTDLRVESITTNGNTGTGVSNYTITSVIKNYGSSVTGTFYVSYYLSTDQYKSSNDRYIGHATVNGLNVGTSTNAQINGVIPKDIAQGNYYIIAVADVTGLIPESNEANNIKSSSSTIFVWRPDLRVSSVTTSGNTAAGASNYTVTGVIQNYGSITSDTFYVSYYLSTDTTKSSNDRYIGHATVNGLNVGTSTNAQINCVIPKDIAQGNYYIIAVADVTGLIPESNEANNIKSSSSTIFVWRPDLRVSSVTTSGNTAAGASNYTVTGVIQNYGSITSDTFYVSYYLSTDTTKSSNDRYIGHATVNGLNGWSSTNAQINCVIPKDIAQGNYYIIAVADVTSLIPESYETNNVRVSSTRIYVSQT